MSKTNKSFDNRIIITGHLGFVGSHTKKALEERGYEVIGYDLKEGNDIRNLSQLLKVFKKGDKILHLAAIARFAEADKDPITAFTTNVKGTDYVAEAAHIVGVERIVYSSTGSVYMPIDETPPITEDFKARGNSIYGCSKYLGELYLKRWTTPYVILRYAHLYGEGKIGHGLVGGFLDRIQRGLSPILYNGVQGNDFTYIKDVVQANILALESPLLNETYNIGTGEELSAKEAGDIICEMFGWVGEVEKKLGRSVDPLHFVYDISKAKKLLKYNPKYSFRDGLKDFYDKSNKKK
jgi:nucleoside-diphosphate-sugar epimerase